MIKLEERRSITTAVFIALLLLSSFYFFKPSTTKNDSKNLLEKATTKETYAACDKVDIPWLAGDRIYWNGWEPKAMFIKADGTFTKRNVYIKEGDEICIVVLLGPTPAYSPQFETEHIGPTDIITMFAQGEHTKQVINLQQHKLQTNAYYASVQFRHQDTYELSAIEEYRSYFWENPISHAYHPTAFTSENKLVVKENKELEPLPICQLNNTRLDLSGAWVDPSVYAQNHREELYTMFEGSYHELAENNKIFIPNSCLLEFKSNGYGSRCLNSKTVHVWGDNNLKRNLKAFNFNTGNWCDILQDTSDCICNDDADEYPWINDPYTPITLDNAWGLNAKIHYNRVLGPLDHTQLIHRISQFTHNLTTAADLVIIGLGNDDIRALRVSAIQFFSQFTKLLANIRQFYPTQPLIIKTPQFFCCGVIPTTSWNAGKSSVFAQLVRDVVDQHKNVYLWDVHQLGTNENVCGSTAVTKRNVVNMENLILWNIVCQ